MKYIFIISLLSNKKSAHFHQREGDKYMKKIRQRAKGNVRKGGRRREENSHEKQGKGRRYVGMPQEKKGKEARTEGKSLQAVM